MRLLDSNIIIYATDPENEWLRIWLEAEPFAISQISQIEVLGHHRITPEEITARNACSQSLRKTMSCSLQT
jgi:predicted nucleic acid-binding protein